MNQKSAILSFYHLLTTFIFIITCVRCVCFIVSTCAVIVVSNEFVYIVLYIYIIYIKSLLVFFSI